MLTLHSPDAHLTIPQPLPELKPSTALFSYCFHTVVNTAAGTQYMVRTLRSAHAS